MRYSYAAENEDELTLNEGEIVNVLEKELEDSGWWKGELNGKVGVFPDNFVEIMKEEVSCVFNLCLLFLSEFPFGFYCFIYVVFSAYI